MTPEAWFAAVTPEPLLVALRTAAGRERTDANLARRFRLFACACARMVWDFLPAEARNGVQTAERFAHGRATAADLRAATVPRNPDPIGALQWALVAAAAACVAEDNPAPEVWSPNQILLAHSHAAPCAARAIATGPPGAAQPPSLPAWNKAFAAARAVQAGYVRDIFLPPGYGPWLDPDWATSTVVALARQMDDTGDFSAVPILADALQDAGCDDEAVLQCCQVSGNAHVRGNWVVDLVLGRL